MTRQQHTLLLHLTPLTSNTSCFITGESISRQFSAAQNHGEGLCALQALMQSCGFGRQLQVDVEMLV